MVGGKVIETIIVDDRVWVNVRDRTYPKETCAIYVERNPVSEAISEGDSLWWQGRLAFWTPVGANFSDLEIPRRSYSGVARPEGH